MTSTITPEEAAALYTQFIEDSEAYMKERDWLAGYEEDADKHALTLAVSRAIAEERERCAKIAEEYGHDRWDALTMEIREGSGE